jgi:DNA/RNA-binding domain of Phe-tRNA-synthetase-like protein
MRIDSSLSSSFPGLRVVELKMESLVIAESDPSLERFKQQVQENIRQRSSIDRVKDQPIFRAYRNFFWRVGIDPTKIRPAGEALTRRILGGRDLPRINTAVDAYNLASVETSIAITAFDLQTISEDALLMRRAKSGESFHGIGMTSPDSLTGVEVVIEDELSKRLIAVYPYRDSDDSKVTLKTSSILFMMCGVPGIEESSLVEASHFTQEFVGRFCGQTSKRDPSEFAHSNNHAP